MASHRMDASPSIDHESERKDPPNSDSTSRRPDSPSAPRHSPAPPLAPLEFLQNHRRGSITDPSLHAAGPSLQSQMVNPGNNSSSIQFRQQDFPHLAQAQANSTPPDAQRNTPLTTRPASPFIFGDASAQPSDSSNPHIRRLWHSPTSDRERASSGTSANNSIAEGSLKAHDNVGVMVGSEQNGTAKRGELQADANGKSPSRKPTEVVANGPSESSSLDYNMRRQMMAAGDSGRSPRAEDGPPGQPRGSPLSPGSHAGQKRKSSDRGTYNSGGGDIDPQLVGPGVHSSMTVDQDGPAPKRRGSAFDTQRIAQLSLYDRRDSADARMAGSPGWWGDRRDSSSSMFSGTSLGSNGGYSPGFPSESHGRPAGSMAAFAWPPNAGPGDAASAPGMHEEVDPNVSRPFDAPVPPHSIASGMHFDRRMSVPDVIPSNSASRPERVLRSRSRPPSRATAAARTSEGPSGNSPGSATDQDGPNSAMSGSSSILVGMMAKETTPYSRSPELRVSHKLAERKRRKEMKDLFDELRDHLPADRGMKASKWEILSKAIDFISQMKQTHQDMARELEMLRHEVESVRHGVPFGHPGGPPHPVVYGQGPPSMPSQYPPPAGAPQIQQPHSRPGSSQNVFPANAGSTASNGKT